MFTSSDMTQDIGRHDHDFGRLDREPIEQVTGIKFRAFCLFVTTGYLFSLEGGNTECRVSAICSRGVS